MSLILIGLGNADFTNLFKYSDSLTNDGIRDMFHFIRYEDIKDLVGVQDAQEKLASLVFEKLSNEVVDLYKKKGLPMRESLFWSNKI